MLLNYGKFDRRNYGKFDRRRRPDETHGNENRNPMFNNDKKINIDFSFMKSVSISLSDASEHFNKRLCPTVRSSVCPSIFPDVRSCVRDQMRRSDPHKRHGRDHDKSRLGLFLFMFSICYFRPYIGPSFLPSLQSLLPLSHHLVLFPSILSHLSATWLCHCPSVDSSSDPSVVLIDSSVVLIDSSAGASYISSHSSLLLI